MLMKHDVKTGWRRSGTVVLGGTGKPCYNSGTRTSTVMPKGIVWPCLVTGWVGRFCGWKLFEGFWLGFVLGPFCGVLCGAKEGFL